MDVCFNNRVPLSSLMVAFNFPQELIRKIKNCRFEYEFWKLIDDNRYWLYKDLFNTLDMPVIYPNRYLGTLRIVPIMELQKVVLPIEVTEWLCINTKKLDVVLPSKVSGNFMITGELFLCIDKMPLVLGSIYITEIKDNPLVKDFALMCLSKFALDKLVFLRMRNWNDIVTTTTVLDDVTRFKSVDNESKCGSITGLFARGDKLIKIHYYLSYSKEIIKPTTYEQATIVSNTVDNTISNDDWDI